MLFFFKKINKIKNLKNYIMNFLKSKLFCEISKLSGKDKTNLINAILVDDHYIVCENCSYCFHIDNLKCDCCSNCPLCCLCDCNTDYINCDCEEDCKYRPQPLSLKDICISVVEYNRLDTKKVPPLLLKKHSKLKK